MSMVTFCAALLSSRRASTRARSVSGPPLAFATGAAFRLRGAADDAVRDRGCLPLMRFRGGRRDAFEEPPVRPDRFTFKGVQLRAWMCVPRERSAVEDKFD